MWRLQLGDGGPGYIDAPPFTLSKKPGQTTKSLAVNWEEGHMNSAGGRLALIDITRSIYTDRDEELRSDETHSWMFD